MCGKSKISLWRNLSTGSPPRFFSTILCFVASFSSQFILFSEQPFYGYYSTLDYHTNTVYVISHEVQPSRQDGFQNRHKVDLHSTHYNWRIIGAILILYYISMDVYVVIGCGSI